jgi:4'-phosphopantetheinyl transferase
MAMRVSNRSSSWDAIVDEAHAWQVYPEDLSPATLTDRCLRWLSPDERARYEQFRTQKQQHDYLTAQALCRTTLSRYAPVHPSEWKFERCLHGKPRIAQPDRFESVRFNLTHTDGLAICLVSRVGEVGVDAEEMSSNVDGALIARHFFSRSEQAWFESLPARQRPGWIFAQWVVKEAYLKGTGTGLDAPERVTVEWGEDGQPVPIGSWQFFLYHPGPRHVAAAAVQRRGASAVSVQWRDAQGFLAIDW